MFDRAGMTVFRDIMFLAAGPVMGVWAEGNFVSLIEAIKVVQAAGKGEVECARRRISKGETQFHVEVNTGERKLTRYTLNAQGKILGAKKVDAD